MPSKFTKDVEIMKYIELEKYLFEISDKKFADFSKSLSNSDYIFDSKTKDKFKSLRQL